MDSTEILALFDRHQRIDIEHPGVRREVTPRVVRFVRAGGGMNWVGYSWLEGADLDAVIAEQTAYFQPLGQPFSWHVYDHDQTPELGGRLEALGFRPDDSPGAVMVLALDSAPRALTAPVTGADLRPITRRGHLEDVIDIMEQVWGGNFGWMRQRLGGHLEIPGYLSLYAAYVDDQPASAAWVYFYPGSPFAGLFGGSTLPAWRGRGLYSALLAIRAQEALRRGYRWLYIDASPMSEPIVARHGFQRVTRLTDYEWAGSS